MKDRGEAITAVALLGIGLSTILWEFVISGGKLGTQTCQNGDSGDCTLSLFLLVWVVAALIVGSLYFALRIRRGIRPQQTGPV